MSRTELNFETIENKVPAVFEATNVPSLEDEFNYGVKLYNDRVKLRKLIKSNVKPLYLDALKRKQEILKRPYYKLQCTYSKAPPFDEYDPCKHAGNHIFDREVLSSQEHIDFLASPRKDYKKYVQKVQCNYVKRFFPHCTTRIDVLATPKKLIIEGNFHDYAHLYNARQRLNLSNYLIDNQIKFTSIETALTYIKEEEKMKKRGNHRMEKEFKDVQLAISKSRQRYVEKIVLAIWEVMKEFLTGPCPGGGPENNILQSVIYQQIIKHVEGAQTSHFQNTIQGLSANLALWTYSFIQTCGFGDIFNPPSATYQRELGLEEEEFRRKIIPVDDYIPVSDTSSSSGIIDEECAEEAASPGGDEMGAEEQLGEEEEEAGQPADAPEGEAAT